MKGFTLIETMVAITILALAIAGPLYAASRALIAAQVARDQLVASYLAQEGIEYVRAVRDNEYLAAYGVGGANVSDTAWTNFVTGLTGTDPFTISGCKSVTCTLDPGNPMGTGSGRALQPCGGSSNPACTQLYLASGSNPQYTQQSGGVQTPFTRTVQSETVSANDERITATVSWNFHNIPYTVKITDHLTAWQ